MPPFKASAAKSGKKSAGSNLDGFLCGSRQNKMLTAASVCVEYRHTAPPLREEFVKSFFPKKCVVHSLSDVDAQEQNKMLADSAEGARREVPQLMQVRTWEISSC